MWNRQQVKEQAKQIDETQLLEDVCGYADCRNIEY